MNSTPTLLYTSCTSMPTSTKNRLVRVKVVVVVVVFAVPLLDRQTHYIHALCVCFWGTLIDDLLIGWPLDQTHLPTHHRHSLFWCTLL